MWLIGGETGAGNTKEVWTSTDGVTWNQEADGDFDGRGFWGAAILNNAIYLAGGYSTAATSEVWRYGN